MKTDPASDFDNKSWPVVLLYCSIGCVILLFVYAWKLLVLLAKALWWFLKAVGRYLYDLSQEGSCSYYDGPVYPSPEPPRPRNLYHVTIGQTDAMHDPAKNPWYFYDQTDPAGFNRSAAFGHHRDRRG